MSPSDASPPSSHLVSSPTPPRSVGLPTASVARAAVGGLAALAMAMLLVWELVTSTPTSSTIDVRSADGGTLQVASPSAAPGSGLPVAVATGKPAQHDRRTALPPARRSERPQAMLPGHTRQVHPGSHPVHPAHPVRPVHHRPPPRPRPRHGPVAAPANSGWAQSECRRRFGHDPARRAACEAALVQMFGQ